MRITVTIICRNGGPIPRRSGFKRQKDQRLPHQHEGNGTQKLQKMIAGNMLPDLIWGQRDADMERLRLAGLLVPLDEYIEKYPNLRTWAGTKILNLLRSPPDNKILLHSELLYGSSLRKCRLCHKQKNLSRSRVPEAGNDR